MDHVVPSPAAVVPVGVALLTVPYGMVAVVTGTLVGEADGEC